MEYPTKQQILESKPRFNKEQWQSIKDKTRIWKKTYYSYDQWRRSSEQGKMLSLCVLIRLIQDITVNRARINPFANEYSFNPRENEINLVFERISIISSLHELGHAIFGPSELDACVFSVHLFKECFPADYKKLVWQGHMLKLPT